MARRHRTRAGLVSVVACAALGTACSDREQLPPLPQVLVVVDTDLPVPLVASRLRIDLYTEDGTWFESNDIARPTKNEWPASFSVFSDDESRTRSVWVRLRAYPEGRQTGDPRLLRAGADDTPAFEPPHLLTVDRLLLVKLVPEKKTTVGVVLRGACVGTMSRLDERGLPGPGAETCIDTARTLAPVVESQPSASADVPTLETSLVGTFGREPCGEAESTDERVCIEGGVTLFGTNSVTEWAPGVSQTAAPTPARVFVLKKFFVDRNEVTLRSARGRTSRAIARAIRSTAPTGTRRESSASGRAETSRRRCNGST